MTNRTVRQVLTARGIRKTRRAQGLGITAAAARFRRLAADGAGPGRDAGWLSRVENGHRPPPPPGIAAAVFGVSEEWLLTPCRHCRYEPPAGFTCDTCGSNRSLREEAATLRWQEHPIEAIIDILWGVRADYLEAHLEPPPASSAGLRTATGLTSRKLTQAMAALSLAGRVVLTGQDAWTLPPEDGTTGTYRSGRCMVHMTHPGGLEARCVLGRDHQQNDSDHIDAHGHHAPVLVRQASIEEARRISEAHERGEVA